MAAVLVARPSAGAWCARAVLLGRLRAAGLLPHAEQARAAHTKLQAATARGALQVVGAYHTTCVVDAGCWARRAVSGGGQGCRSHAQSPSLFAPARTRRWRQHCHLSRPTASWTPPCRAGQPWPAAGRPVHRPNRTPPCRPIYSWREPRGASIPRRARPQPCLMSFGATQDVRTGPPTVERCRRCRQRPLRLRQADAGAGELARRGERQRREALRWRARTRRR